MTRAERAAYDATVDVPRNRALRSIAAGLGLVFLCVTAPCVAARATTSAVDVGDQPAVDIIARGKGNDVTIRVWDRGTVQVDTGDDQPPPVVERRSVVFGTPRVPLVRQIPPTLYAMRDGALPSGALPPEGFVYANFRPGAHDVVVVDAPPGAHLTVTVPAATGLLALHVGGGTTSVEGYRGSNLFLVQNNGRAQVTGATTTAFVQLNYGTFYAADSTFARIRVRGVAAHDVFERCRTKQVEATSVSGTIVYDGGTFDPGLARFESETGIIALGVNGPAQLVGRSQDGRVFTLFERRDASVDQRDEGTAIATLGGSGGPLVNAISERGNVYFYDGSLARRRGAGPEWRAVHEAFNLHRRAQRQRTRAAAKPARARTSAAARRRA